MGYDRGDSFPFDFEPNWIAFGSKSKGKLSLSPWPYPIQFEKKWNTSFLSAGKIYNDQAYNHPRTERLASLGIPGDLLKKHLKALQHHGTMVPMGLRCSLNWVPLKREPLSKPVQILTSCSRSGRFGQCESCVWTWVVRGPNMGEWVGLGWVDLLFVQFILVQPVFVQSIPPNPNLT